MIERRGMLLGGEVLPGTIGPPKEGNSMSDFYRRRRVVIKDATALMTFFVGFVWSGAFVWPLLANQVDNGDMIRGLAYFLAAVLGSGVLAGLIGLETGVLLGDVWEHYHRRRRSMMAGPVLSSAAWSAREEAVPQFRPVSGSSPNCIDRVYFTEGGVYAASFVTLADRVRPGRHAIRRIRAALARTDNIGAWDGARLIGAVRVLTDGYTFGAVADIMVDPEYQRLGIGRMLMTKALAASPDHRLLVEAKPESIGFFERVAGGRGLPGFVFTPETGIR